MNESLPPSESNALPLPPTAVEMKTQDVVPIATETEARKAFAAESARIRRDFFQRIETIFAAWKAALGEPGRVQLREMAQQEKELRSLLGEFRSAPLTRKDRHKFWVRYQETWQELTRLKEQTSLAARAYFQSQADEIIASLPNDGPQQALARLKQLQKERAGYIFSRSDRDEVESALRRTFVRIREEARKQSPWYRRLSAMIIKEKRLLSRLQRQADLLRSLVAETRKQWEMEDKNALRAALLKERLTTGEVELAQLEARMATVRAGIEKLEARLKSSGEFVKKETNKLQVASPGSECLSGPITPPEPPSSRSQDEAN